MQNIPPSQDYVPVKKIGVMRRVEMKISKEKWKKLKSFHKIAPEIFLGSVLKSVFFDNFRRRSFLQTAVKWWEISLETCSRYEKHSSESGRCFSKKNQGHPTRGNENIAEEVQKNWKVSLNIAPEILFWSVQKSLFHMFRQRLLLFLQMAVER